MTRCETAVTARERYVLTQPRPQAGLSSGASHAEGPGDEIGVDSIVRPLRTLLIPHGITSQSCLFSLVFLLDFWALI